MPTTTNTADSITVRPLDSDLAWWPAPPPARVLALSPPTRDRVAAVIVELAKHIAEVRVATTGMPDREAIVSCFGSCMHAVVEGSDALYGLTPDAKALASRFTLAEDEDRTAWKRAYDEFHMRLGVGDQRGVLLAYVDQFEADKVTAQRALLRRVDKLLADVETWLAGAGTR